MPTSSIARPVARPIAPLALAIACALALPVAAQTREADGATRLDAVIVTGTRATDRTVLESTSPIDVLVDVYMVV